MQRACVNVRHSPTFTSGAEQVQKVLTAKSSVIWGTDLVQVGARAQLDRPLVSYEEFRALGYPILLPVKHPLSKLLPEKLMPEPASLFARDRGQFARALG